MSERHLQVAPLVVALLAATWLASCSSEEDAPAAVEIGKSRWKVELATTEAQRVHGLSEREQLAPGTGMLFAFPRAEQVSFHMLNCHVPLDVAFLSDDLTVVNIRTMPVEDNPGNPKMAYPSRYPVRYALEVSAGEFRRAGVKIGDRATLLGQALRAAKDAR